MPDERLREQITGGAASALKKIIASKGKVKGNFYYVGDVSGTDVGVVITLSTRDAKGTKVIVLGKKLRKDIRNGKYGMGTVCIKDNKLLFEQSAGTLSAAHIKNGFKKTLSLQNGLKFLSRAVVRKASASTEEEVDAPVSTESSAPASAATTEEQETFSAADFASVLADLSAEEQKELGALVGEQQTLDQSNATLVTAFSNAQDDDAVLEQAIESSMDNITKLSSSGASMAEIQHARFELAELMYVGEEPFQEVGGVLPKHMCAILSAATDDALSVLQAKHARTSAQIKTIYKTLRKMPPGQPKRQYAAESVAQAQSMMESMQNYLSQIQNMKY